MGGRGDTRALVRVVQHLLFPVVPNLAMTVASRGFSRTVAPVWGFSRGMTGCCPDGLLTARCSCTPAPGQAAGWPLCTSVSMGRGGNGGTERAGSISPRHTCTDMLLLLSWWLSVFPRGGQSWGSETQDLAPSALGRGWGAGGPLSTTFQSCCETPFDRVYKTSGIKPSIAGAQEEAARVVY